MSKENQRRADQGWIERSKEAAAHAERASGSVGLPRNRQGWGSGQSDSNRPMPVNIVEGQDEFFNALKRAFGVDTEGRSGSNDDFTALISSQQAMTQATQEVAQEMKAMASMVRDFTVNTSAYQTKMLAEQQLNQQQMNLLISFLGNAGAGIGGGGGGGTSHSSYARAHPHNPSLGGFGTYGGVRQNLRAAAANYVNQNYGIPSAGRHVNAQTMAGLTHNSRVAQVLQHGGVMAAGRMVPGIGPAIMTAEGINEGAEWLTNQRAKNAYYQSIYGGENAGGFGQGVGSLLGYGSGEVTGGLGNRMAEEGFVLSNRFSAGGMSEDQSRQAFKGVSELGYTGQRRDGSLAFIGEQYKKLGMDIQQSLSLVQLSAKYAQGNLGGVANQLQGVTKAAQATGQSAAQLQQAFIGNYQAALRGGAGGQAAGLAGAMTAVTGGASRDLGGFSFGGMFSNVPQQYMLSAQVGMTPGQVQAQAGMGNLNPQLMGASRMTNQFMGSVLGAGLQQKLTDLIKQAGGKEKVMASPGTMDDIALQLMNDRSWDVLAVRRALQSAGISVPEDASDQQVAKFYVSWFAGNNFETQAKKNIANSTIKRVSDEEWNRRDKNKLTGGSSFVNDEMAGATKDLTDQSWLSQIFGSDDYKSAKTRDTTIKYYAEYQRTHDHASDPAIEALIKNYGNDPNVRIRVRSKDGKDKAVTLADAIRYYPDQLSTGSAYMMSKNADTHGKKLSELPGVTPDAGVVPGQNGISNSAKESTFGDDADQFAKDNGYNGGQNGAQSDNAKDSSGGKVTVSLQPEVARLFQFSGTGVNIDSGPNARPPAAQGGPK